MDEVSYGYVMENGMIIDISAHEIMKGRYKKQIRGFL